MRNPRPPNLREDRAWRSLTTMQDGLSEFLERQLRNGFGISDSDYRVLTVLAEQGDGGRLRQFDLGRLLHWEKGRLSRHLSRMESRGLVSRVQSLSDLRGTVVGLTPEGEALIEEAATSQLGDVRAAVLDHLTPEELDALTAITRKIRDRLATLEVQPAEQF
jgi:DNA-binding MarR family transcriptional regulator